MYHFLKDSSLNSLESVHTQLKVTTVYIVLIELYNMCAGICIIIIIIINKLRNRNTNIRTPIVNNCNLKE